MEIILKARHFLKSLYNADSCHPIARALTEDISGTTIIVSVSNVSIGKVDYTMQEDYTVRRYIDDCEKAAKDNYQNAVIRTITLVEYYTKRKRKGF